MVTTLNREQNRMELFCVNPRSTVAKSVLVEQWNAWLTPATYEDIRYFADFFVVTSCRTGWDQLYQYSYTGTLQRRLTNGDYDVTAYYGYDPKTGCHFYQSAETGAIDRVVCRVDAKGKTVRMTADRGVGSVSSVSPTLSCFMLKYSNVTTPPVFTLVNPANG